MFAKATLLQRVTVVFLTMLASRAAAQEGMHGEGHATMHPWYQTLRQPGTGISCCSDKDCRPTVSRRVGATVEVLVDGEWIAVTADKILDVPSPDLRSHVCAAAFPHSWPDSVKQLSIICVILGAGA